MPSYMNRIRAAVGDTASLQAGFNYYGRCYQVILLNICLLSHSQADLCPESTRSHIATYIWHRANRSDFLTEITSQFRVVLSIITWLLSTQRIKRKSFFLLASSPLQKCTNKMKKPFLLSPIITFVVNGT